MSRQSIPSRRRVLVVDDDRDLLRLLARRLELCGYESVTAETGERGWEILDSRQSPEIAIVDWMLPGLDGLEMCRRLRARKSGAYVYVILITSRERKPDVVIGLDAGADDYVTKPFDWNELRCRLRTGERVLELKSRLDQKVRSLKRAALEAKMLEGLLPICTRCKRIRDASDRWHPLESYIEMHSDILFTHSLCEACLRQHYPAYAQEESRS